MRFANYRFDHIDLHNHIFICEKQTNKLTNSLPDRLTDISDCPATIRRFVGSVHLNVKQLVATPGEPQWYPLSGLNGYIRVAFSPGTEDHYPMGRGLIASSPPANMLRQQRALQPRTNQKRRQRRGMGNGGGGGSGDDGDGHRDSDSDAEVNLEMDTELDANSNSNSNANANASDSEPFYDFLGFEVPREYIDEYQNEYDFHFMAGANGRLWSDYGGLKEFSRLDNAAIRQSLFMRIFWQGIPDQLRQRIYLAICRADAKKAKFRTDDYYRKVAMRALHDRDRVSRRLSVSSMTGSPGSGPTVGSHSDRNNANSNSNANANATANSGGGGGNGNGNGNGHGGQSSPWRKAGAFPEDDDEPDSENVSDYDFDRDHAHKYGHVPLRSSQDLLADASGAGGGCSIKTRASGSSSPDIPWKFHKRVSANRHEKQRKRPNWLLHGRHQSDDDSSIESAASSEASFHRSVVYVSDNSEDSDTRYVCMYVCMYTRSQINER